MARLMQAPSRLGGAPARIQQAPKVAMQFYSSPEWKGLRSDRMKDADYREAKRRANGGRVILDHIDEIKDGGAPLDPKNTQWLTMAEHAAKTERAKANPAASAASPTPV